ncbi:pre-mRNA-splicing factor SYF1 [Selaginella moellendorffii]|uniref:pre-mRNA-splicing factor SYF1 n=1 Tax=Selaginella moellendorffii TaxID=88036 RepID=UPI000D1C692C|nr:pre-mRNA-splicing factor SYF1 [Selaginella moellendorffii]|eukprot:XP_024524023.1 pre-mRNA-splicing factor SYF1 [Selaginella moellendorffii]
MAQQQSLSEMNPDLLPTDEELVYEEEILRNSYSMRLWWRYIQARFDVPFRKRIILYERALKFLPGSYKLWHSYLLERMEAVRGLPPGHASFESVNNTFERALVTMHKMPRIWLLYLQSLVEQRYVTKARRTFDRALFSLPVTQHERIWELYLRFVRQPGVPSETGFRVHRRFLKFEPSHMEDFIEFLMDSGKWQEAAERLAEVLNDQSFQSVKSKTRHQLWLELCDLLTKHAHEVSGLQVDAIIRGGIRNFTDEVGRLWTSLADYYARLSLFEKVRDVYEEGMTTVTTVRDFSLIFDAYSKFEESLLSAKMSRMGEEDEESEEELDESEMVEVDADGNTVALPEKELKKRRRERKILAQWKKGNLKDFWVFDENDVDLLLARFSYLIERRPELLSSVVLRQNPHNVHEWHKRASLFKDNPARQVRTYTEAVMTVDPFKAVGKYHSLWTAYAHLYESQNDLKNARVVFEKAVQKIYRTVDDLASLYCAWAEMEMKHKNYKTARDILKKATMEPSFATKKLMQGDRDLPVQMKLYKSLKLWSTYVDLEESLGTLESTRKVYDQILVHKIATPQIIINYAAMLEENKYFEDAFGVYEKGVQVFKYPHARDIWTTYLTKFVQRYGGKKLERARDLFEQAVEKVTPEDAKPVYLQYAKLEEDFGLAQRAMKIYDRATKAVPDGEKLSVYDIYIARAAEIYGVPKTRDIYEEAIQSGLPDKDAKLMCLKFAELERTLGEIDRARAIYIYASQMADPRSDTEVWSKWHDFEVTHGNHDTFKEMLRIKRSVHASYTQMHMIMPEYLMQRDQGRLSLEETVDTLKRAGVPEDEMAALERQIAPVGQTQPPSTLKEGLRQLGFVSAGVQAAEGRILAPGDAKKNPDEIELPESDEEDETGEKLVQKAVPDAVFGGLAHKAENGGKEDDGKAPANPKAGKENNRDKDEPLGALERLKRQRRA